MVTIYLRPGALKGGRSNLHDSPHYHLDPRGAGWLVHSHPWRPPTDVYENEENLVVRVEIAAMREQDFTITLDGRILVIRGTRADNSDRQAFYQMEIHYGEFVTEFVLPYDIVPEKVEAVYQQGMLTVVLPKAKPRRIPIEEE